ncbi:SRPBCC domain-containing protein [Dactylosporangium sp. CA-233914]|uniref:SRPBCC domain-containing protein n=1 Tax=Dactylosporangium sp. CA-233914 TaxID=3239934 RepID=UPI003D941820
MTSTSFTAEPGSVQVVIERRFAAALERVYRAWTDPDLIPRWLGPRELTTTVEAFEARDGGRWRITHRAGDGSSFTFHGLFHGDPGPQRIVRTYECAERPGHVQLDTVTLTDLGGATLLRQNTVYQSVEERDFYLGAGAETGVRDSHARLDALLTED